MSVYFSPVFKLHKAPYRHPEAPDRLDAFMEGVRDTGGEVRETAWREDVWQLIELAHAREYVQSMRALCKREFAEIDGDTYISSGTCDAAALAVSTAVAAVEKRETAAIAARPPGHHAGRFGRALTAPSQGFCIFNTAAIAALYLGEGAVVVDIDVHHGNGTQEVLYDRDLLYISTHQHPNTLYPGTGYPDEVGVGRGEGYNVNIPLPPMLSDDAYREVVDEVIVPVLRQYGPKYIIVSLGWDAHREDPLANMNLTINSYLHAFRALLSLQKPVLFLLEGGYNREVLKRGAAALIHVLNGREPPLERPTVTSEAVYRKFREELATVREHLSKYWRL